MSNDTQNSSGLYVPEYTQKVKVVTEVDDKALQASIDLLERKAKEGIASIGTAINSVQAAYDKPTNFSPSL